MIKTNLTQEDNLIIQSYYTSLMLLKLDDGFLETEFFERMDLLESIKDTLRTIGVTNQGCALMVLYALLVVPREVVRDSKLESYQNINAFLLANTLKTTSSYKSDKDRIDFLRHIRNSVSHARVSFRDSEVIVFDDTQNRTNERFYSELRLADLPKLLTMLQEVHLEYFRGLP